MSAILRWLRPSARRCLVMAQASQAQRARWALRVGGRPTPSGAATLRDPLNGDDWRRAAAKDDFLADRRGLEFVDLGAFEFAIAGNELGEWPRPDGLQVAFEG